MTTAGRVFYDKANAALTAVKEAREAASAVQGLKRGTLTIGTVRSLPAFVDLSSLLACFHAQHPGIDIHLCQDSSVHLLGKMRNGAVYLAFMRAVRTAARHHEHADRLRSARPLPDRKSAGDSPSHILR